VKYSGKTTSNAPLSLAALTDCEMLTRFPRMLLNASKSGAEAASAGKVRGPSEGHVCAMDIFISVCTEMGSLRSDVSTRSCRWLKRLFEGEVR
jgi:hypothetical protein